MIATVHYTFFRLMKNCASSPEKFDQFQTKFETKPSWMKENSGIFFYACNADSCAAFSKASARERSPTEQ